MLQMGFIGVNTCNPPAGEMTFFFRLDALINVLHLINSQDVWSNLVLSSQSTQVNTSKLAREKSLVDSSPLTGQIACFIFNRQARPMHGLDSDKRRGVTSLFTLCARICWVLVHHRGRLIVSCCRGLLLIHVSRNREIYTVTIRIF